MIAPFVFYTGLYGVALEDGSHEGDVLPAWIRHLARGTVTDPRRQDIP